MAKCGDFGGEKSPGVPCGLAAGWGTSEKTGPCRRHRPHEPSSDEIEHLKKRAFLAAYETLGNISRAARSAEIARGTHYDWMEKDPAYRAGFEKAHRRASDLLEEEARRRAMEGFHEPVVYKGQFTGEWVMPDGSDPWDPETGRRKAGAVFERNAIRRYSDTLLIFLMKGNNPDKFGDKLRHSGVVGMPERPEDYHRMTDEEIAQRAARAASRAIGRAP
jgi:hypothetical protein